MNDHSLPGSSQTEAPQQTAQGKLLPQEFQALDLAFLGSLLPGIIHNLATPLSGVLGATQLLEKRASTIEELVEQLESLAEAERAELVKQFDRNRTNVDILARNAKHLADLLQVLVQRINRGSCNAPEYYSLNDLLQNELRFLDSNLTFKHKVKKQVSLAPDLPVIKCVYGHVAAALDEFVISTLSLHDFGKGISEMDFATACDSDNVTLDVIARLVLHPNPMDISGPLESYLDRLREENWKIQCECSDVRRALCLSCSRPAFKT
jgi:signal transduction histidine kinase